MSLHLVTGGNGFVGQALVQSLLQQGHHVRVVDTQTPTQNPSQIEYYQGSVTDRDLLRRALQNVEVVHHAAAIVPLIQSPTIIEEVNVKGTEIVFSAARKAGVQHFNFISSSAVYGITNKACCPLSENSATLPFEVYGKSKLRAEQYIQTEMRMHPTFSCAILRPRTIIGPGRVGIFDLLFNWIQNNRTIYLIGNGSNSLQLVHVQDFVHACQLTAKQRKCGIFNIGAQNFGSIREAIQDICLHAKSSSRIQPVPISFALPSLLILNKLHLSPFGPWHYNTFHRDCYFNTSKAETDLGWRARYSNTSMLIEAYDWFIQNRTNGLANGSVHQRTLRRGILSLFMSPQ